jgi:hypothetical protein
MEHVRIAADRRPGEGLTSTERARNLKARRKAEGLVQCNVWVRAEQAAEIKHAADLMLANPELRVARLMNVRTGRLCGLKG